MLQRDWLLKCGNYYSTIPFQRLRAVLKEKGRPQKRAPQNLIPLSQSIQTFSYLTFSTSREKEAIMLQEKLNLQNEMAALEHARISDEEFSRREIEKETQRKKQFRDDLREQIINSSYKNQQLYEEFLKEKRYLDEIVQRIQDEQME